MTTPTPTQALEPVGVTQADRDAAAEYMRRFPDLRLPEAFARHRQSSNAASVECAVEEAQFLCDRLDELDWSMSYDDFGNSYNGHVDPSHSRLKRFLASLSTLTAEPKEEVTDATQALLPVTPEEYDPDFVEAWAAQEDAGYIYSESNIAKVYLGWQLARQSHPAAGMLEAINEALAFYDALGLPHAPGEAEVLDKLDQARRKVTAALTPSALSDLQRLGQEYDGDALREESEPQYLIRKNGAYYRPNAAGYTYNVDEAGRYTLDEAIRHSHPNGPDGPRDGITYELAPPLVAPEADEAGRAQMIERLRIMAKQRTSSQMDEDEREGADFQGAYDWFCDESRAIYAALTSDRPVSQIGREK